MGVSFVQVLLGLGSEHAFLAVVLPLIQEPRSSNKTYFSFHGPTGLKKAESKGASVRI